MKIEVNKNNSIQLSEVFNPIVLVTNDGEEMVITMRDSGFEFTYQNEIYHAKNGFIEKIEEPVKIEEIIVIPTNLHEAFDQLDKILNEEPEYKETFKLDDEEKAIINLHHGIGRWIRNEWGLWSGSELKTYFEELGLHHADDMSSVILTSFHRYLNGRELHIDQQVEHYKEFWKNNA